MMLNKYRRLANDSLHPQDIDDPMSSVSNLLDVFLVFIVGLLVSFMVTYQLQDLMVPDSTVTIMKQSAEGEMTIITKKATKIEAVKISKSEAEGRGTRLGTAYQLEDGTMVYLPDEMK